MSRVDESRWSTLRFDASDLATILASGIVVPVAAIAAFVPIPGATVLAVLVTCRGASIAVRSVTSGNSFVPAAFLSLGYLITVFGPALDITAFGPDDRRLLLGNGPEYLVFPMLLVVIYVAALITGLIISSQRDWRLPFVVGRWDYACVDRGALVLLSVGAVGFLTLLLTTGRIPPSISDLSAKRRPPSEYIRWSTQFLHYGSIVLFANHLTAGSIRRKKAGIMFSLSFLPAAFVPVGRSQKSRPSGSRR